MLRWRDNGKREGYSRANSATVLTHEPRLDPHPPGTQRSKNPRAQGLYLLPVRFVYHQLGGSGASSPASGQAPLGAAAGSPLESLCPAARPTAGVRVG